MRITLNLATHPYVELRPLYQRLRVVALLLLLTAVLLGWVLSTQKQKAAVAQARATTLDASIARTRSGREQAENSMRQPQNAAVLMQAHFLNNLFLHKSFSWTAVMMDLEQVLPGGVQVLSIDPVPAKDGTVTIHMRVAGPREKAVALVRNLEHSRRFRTPRIVAETSQAQNQNGRPSPTFEPTNIANGVNFDVLAEYNPLQPHETKEATANANALQSAAAQKNAAHETRQLAHVRKPGAGSTQ
jgi:type IV pilus assembly protein PilN